MGDETYEGWPNRETWAVALWINNDQGWQESVRDAVRDVLASLPEGYNGEPFPEPYKATHAGEAIKAKVEEDNAYTLTGDPDGSLPASLVCDLLGHAMARVDWTEIGASFLTDLGEQS